MVKKCEHGHLMTKSNVFYCSINKGTCSKKNWAKRIRSEQWIWKWVGTANKGQMKRRKGYRWVLAMCRTCHHLACDKSKNRMARTSKYVTKYGKKDGLRYLQLLDINAKIKRFKEKHDL